MSYKKAEQVLPDELIALIQTYIDGECIYIPRKENHRKSWGESTCIRFELEERNAKIYKDWCVGMKTSQLAEKYCLSDKSIQRILRNAKLSERKRAVATP